MRRFVALILSCLLASSGSGQEKVNLQLQQAGAKPTNVAAYKIGLDMGAQLRAGGLEAEDIASADFLAGFMDALKGAEPRVSQAEVEKALTELGKKVQARMEQAAKENLAKATAFLEENKKQDGVRALPSGLQYQVVRQGSGATPKADSTVVVHYEGKLMDGTVFDSSLKGEPRSFKVNGVVEGWKEALTRMKVGDKWKLVIPPSLGYREEGFGAVIPPNSALLFEVELLEVK